MNAGPKVLPTDYYCLGCNTDGEGQRPGFMYVPASRSWDPCPYCDGSGNTENNRRAPKNAELRAAIDRDKKAIARVREIFEEHTRLENLVGEQLLRIGALDRDNTLLTHDNAGLRTIVRSQARRLAELEMTGPSPNPMSGCPHLDPCSHPAGDGPDHLALEMEEASA